MPGLLTNIILEKKQIPRGKTKYDVELYIVKCTKTWNNHLRRIWRKHGSIKFDLRITVRLQKRVAENYIYTTPCFRSPSQIVLAENDIPKTLQTCEQRILDAYDVHMKDGSGWTLVRVEHSQINVYRYSTMGGGGGSYKGLRASLLPPQFVSHSHSIVTFPPTTDQKCFIHCILAALHPTPPGKRCSDLTQYMKYESTLNTSALSYPVNIGQIPEFEKNNALTINVLTLNKNNDIVFVYKSERNGDQQINLLLYKSHYHLIKSFNCFLNFAANQKRKLCQKCGRFCRYPGVQCSDCLRGGDKCQKVGESSCSTLTFMPENSQQQFSNFNNVVKHPFVYYCDLETMLSNDFTKPNHTKTKRTKKHLPIAIGLIRISCEKNLSHTQPIIHTGQDCIEKFYQTLQAEIEYMDDILLNVNHPIHMSRAQEQEHKISTQCYVCKSSFEHKGEDKMRDHNHIKRKRNYLGAICNSCNLNRTDTRFKKTPIIFHNGGRFDIHFLIQNVHMLHQKKHTRLIGKSGENIMAMELFEGRMIVLDSFNHLSSSLASLINIMKASGKKFPHTTNSIQNDERGLELLSRKGVFPYEYVTSEDILVNTMTIPNEECFHDNLSENDVSPEDYQHAKVVWNYFKCRNLMEYMTIYLKSDITLLADVFENYRQFFFDHFGLDCTKYISLPGLSYDCMLRYTGVKLDYVRDYDTYDFLRRGMRGGVSMIPLRYARANNSGVADHDPSLPTSYLMYFDCNALYSSIMTKKLPYKNFKWERRLKESTIKKYHPNDSTGYIIECDLAYPSSIHDITRDLPLAPEHITVKEGMLSHYSLKLARKLGINPNDKIAKLISTQFDKSHYVCHIENLQFYLQKGMKLKRIYNVLKFKQKAIFKPYIEFCIEERNKPGTTQDEKQMWKLLCNSIFGKTIMNVEKMNAIRIETDCNKVLKSISSPRFRHADVINPKVVQITTNPRKKMIKTPYHIGMTILELSKLHLMRLHYDYFMQTFGRLNLELCMTDTDSLLYRITTEGDIMKDLKKMGVIDFGNYPKDHPYHDDCHSGVLFYLKDEGGGKSIKSFVGLRAKSYSIEYGDNHKVVGKGIPKHKLLNIQHEDMVHTLRKNVDTNVCYNQLRSYKHEMFSIHQQKKALSAFDNKRYICENGVTTLPYGHIDTLGEPNG